MPPPQTTIIPETSVSISVKNLNQENRLKKYSIDLTQLAKEGKLDPVIGRDDEIRRTIQILSRRTKNNPALVGPAGVGKTAIMVVSQVKNEVK